MKELARRNVLRSAMMLGAVAATRPAIAGDTTPDPDFKALVKTRPPLLNHPLPAPARMALLNIDMQNCFVEDSWMAPANGREILANVNRIAQTCRRRGMLVIHTAGMYRADGSNLPHPLTTSNRGRNGPFSKGSSLVALHPDLTVAPDDIVIEKPRWNAFHATDLDLILRAHRIDTLIVTGLASNVCCECTIRDAAVRDYNVFFVSDASGTCAMGDMSGAALHKATCTSLGQLFATVLPTASVVTQLERDSTNIQGTRP
jgi:nicotinamidase-related amidase